MEGETRAVARGMEGETRAVARGVEGDARSSAARSTSRGAPACIVTTRDGLAFEDGIDRGRIVVSGADTDGRYSLMEWTVGVPEVEAGERISYGPHRHHACEETFLIRRGSLDFLLGDEVRTLHAGDFVRVPAGTRHGYANTSGAEVDMLVSFMPAGLEMLFVRYRTDTDVLAPGEGFIADAIRLHSSEFEA